MKTLASALAAGTPIMRPSDPINEHFAQIERRKPRLKRVYRPCESGDLSRIARQAFDEHKLRLLPPVERQRAAAELADEMERIFPRADMEVLARWPSSVRQPLGGGLIACAYARTSVLVDGERFDLPRPIMAPNSWKTFSSTAHGEEHREPPPLAAEFVKRAGAIDADRERLFTGVFGWPSKFKFEHKRYPTWGEIAEAWPQLAALIGGVR